MKIVKRESMIQRLQVDLSRGQVVTITGTGVSITVSGNPDIDGHKVCSWVGLLGHGVSHCQDIGVLDPTEADLLTLQINTGKTDFLIHAAEMVSQRMQSRSSGVFRGWLKNSVGRLTVADGALIKAVANLPGVLATLNYDHLIEDVTDRHAVTWLHSDAVQDVLMANDTNCVLHLHGSYKEPESVVLGLSSYLSIKEHPHAKSVLNLFAIDRTLLFIGCGSTFQDPNFARLIEWAREALEDVTPRHYVLCRNAEFSGMQTMLATTPWLQPLAYGDGYGDLAPFLKSLAPASRPAAAAKVAVMPLDFDAYRKAMRNRYNRLKLEELDPTTHDIRPLTLTAMFIEQNARECATFIPRVFELPKELQEKLRKSGEMDSADLDDSTVGKHHRAYLDQVPRPILDIISDPNCSRLVILGDPGSGKSTLLQHLLLQWAETAPSDPAPVPLLVELREFAQVAKNVDSFLAYLQSGNGVRWHLDQSSLATWLQQHPSLVLFDGLDEIFDLAQRKLITTAIHRFSHEFPMARIIVTSRVVGYQHQAWNDEGFRHFMLQDLDPPQIATFLSRWHQGAYDDATAGDAKRVLLERAISDSAAIHQLAGNPLLLTMMAILNRTQDLPRDRAELYEQCARLLLHQWKVDMAFQSDPTLATASLDFKDKRGLLLRIARTMQTCDRGLAGNLIDETTLERTLAAGLKEATVARPDRAARSLIEQLRGRNFMLCFMGGHSYAFVHRTFLEYFCAVEIRERFEKEQSLTLDQMKTEIFAHWVDETWHEVLCLLAGMIAVKFVEEILEWLLAQPDPSNTRHHVFLAIRCAGEVRKRAKLGAMDARLLKLTRDLTRFDPPHYYEPWHPDGRTAENVRERALELLASVWPDVAENAAWFKRRTLLEKGWHAPATALRLLMLGWKDAPGTLEWLIDQIQSEAAHPAKPIMLYALANQAPGHPDILTILHKIIRSNGDTGLRGAAVASLAAGWTHDPDAFALIKRAAVAERQEFIRFVAMQELSQRWSGDPAVADILEDRAFHDPSESNRRNAVRFIAKISSGAASLPALIKHFIRTETGDYARLQAMEILIREARNDPKTVTLLVKMAKGERSQAIRIQALGLLASDFSAEAGVFELVAAFAASDKNPVVRESAVTLLGQDFRTHSDTRGMLVSFARHDAAEDVRTAAIRELAHGWGGNADVLSLLRSMLDSPESDTVRQVVVQSIARGWDSEPATIALLKAVVQRDTSDAVRTTALRALSRYASSDAGILPILQSYVSFRGSADVRLAAVSEIANGQFERDAVLGILTSSAADDKNGAVRERALTGLAHLGYHDPTIRLMLENFAKEDKNKYVRVRALRELARGWRHDSNVEQLIRSLSAGAECKALRAAAEEELEREWGLDVDHRLIFVDTSNTRS